MNKYQPDFLRTPFFLAVVLLIATCKFTAAQEFRPDLLVIPRSDRPPTIDGRIQENEWDGATRVEGFIQSSGEKMVPPNAAFNVMHDGERLYLAIHQELPDGHTPTREYRKRDAPVSRERNQVQLALTPPEDTGEFRTYQLITNAYGAINDTIHRHERLSESSLWNGDWNVRSTSEKGKYWNVELSISADDLGVPELKSGREWRGRVSVSSPHRSWPFTGGWHWLMNVERHARWIIGGDETSARVHNVRSLLNNELDLNVDVRPSTADASYEVRVSVGDEVNVTRRVKPANDPRVRIKQKLPESDETRTLQLLVTGPGGRTLLRSHWPFVPGTEADPDDPNERETLFPVEATYGPESRKLRVEVDRMNHPKQSDIRAVRVTVVPEKKADQPRKQFRLTDFEHDRAGRLVQLDRNIPPGTYTVHFELLGEDDTVLDENSDSFEVLDLDEEFIWHGTDVGTDYTIGKDFEPIRVDGNRLKIWNRTYVFENGVLPSQVISDGRKILTRPISLTFVRDGETIRAEPVGDVTITDRSDRRVRLKGTYRAEDVRFSLRGYLDFDGMLYYTLDAGAEEAVDRVYVSMPVNPGRARYYHSTAGVWNPALGYVPEKAGKKPFWTSDGFAKFVPYLGISDDERALQWFADHDHQWVRGSVPAIQLFHHGGEVETRVNLVQKRAVPSFEDLHFGFIATPVKPLPDGWRNVNLHFNSVAGSRFNFFWGDGHGGGLSLHDKRGLLEKLDVDVPADRDPGRVLQELPASKTATVDGLSTTGDTITCPFHNVQLYFPGPESRAFRTYYDSEWTHVPEGNWYRMAPVESYREFYLWHFDKWVRHLKVKGVYYDEVYMPPNHNRLNGSGKLMPDGTVRPSHNLMDERTFMRRVRQTFLNHDVEPFIWAHTTNYMAPHAISWTDVAMFGEDRVPGPGKDYIEDAPAILFRAIGRSQKFGLPPVWMHMVKRSGESGISQSARQVGGWCWMHDTSVEMHTSPRCRALQALRATWGIAKEDVEYLPYWKQEVITTQDDQHIVSVWTRPESALVQVFNLHESDEANRVTLSIDLAELGLDGTPELYELTSAPKYAGVKTSLDRLDAGEVEGEETRNRIKEKLNDLTEPDFDLTELERVGTGEDIELVTGPRRFRLLVLRTDSGK